MVSINASYIRCHHFDQNSNKNIERICALKVFKDIKTSVWQWSRSLTYILCRGVARGWPGGPEPPGIWQISEPYSNQGGRLCPSHYCQPPRIQKAIYTSAFGLVSALLGVLSSKWLRPYCNLANLIFIFFSDICQLFEHYCQYSPTSYLPGGDEYLYLSNYG